ncbi:MAG: chloride channel protein [Pseudomonadota bacterium]|nr:chloride channel protein [Pseudomonadota bacterium]
MRRSTSHKRSQAPERFGEYFSLVRFRRQLAYVDALPQLSLLALLAGALTGLVMVAFRLAIELPLAALLPGGDKEGFEQLPLATVLLLPLIGGLSLGVIFDRLRSEDRGVGVTHVMERLARHQGHVPGANALVQFTAGILALATGQSGGREGPAIHLGAAASSVLGQRLRLPNNSIRTLVGCGTAAAISASFNTPIAGVIFAMEVVMMEYSVVSFIPVIIASVTATLISVAVFGGALAFNVPAMTSAGFWEVPFFVGCGILIGLLAAAFIYCTVWFSRFSDRDAWQRFGAAGLLTGLAGLIAPEILGVGYDTVDLALVGQLSLSALLIIGALKLVVSAAATGLGLPIGFIGPVLVIGALAGGAFGMVGVFIWPAEASNSGFHALVGMAAMMGAVLQAPLAALMTVLELTGKPNAIVPAMLTIVVANLTCSAFHGPRSLFLLLLERRGLTFDADPLTLALQRAGVGSQMERRIARCMREIDFADARSMLSRDPRWIVVDSKNAPMTVLAAADLERHLESLEPADDEDGTALETKIDLLEIPGLRKDVVLLQSQATLHEAMTRLKDTGREAVCVTRTAAPMITPIIGVLTREDIEKYYGLRG